MKKIFTVVAVAVISLSFTSCRQDDEAVDFSTPTKQDNKTFSKTGDSIKTDTVTIKARPVDPDPPVKDGTSW